MYKVLITLFLFIFSGCEKQIFYPDSHIYRTPEEFQVKYDEVHFSSQDGTKLHGWWLKPDGYSNGLMVVAHGNAQNLSSHFTGWVWLVKAGYELFIFDYRGYGESDGEVDLEDALDDTVAAMQYAQEHYRGNLYICGQSIGGMLVINALSRHPFKRYRFAIIDSTYSELEEIGRETLSRTLITWPFQWMAYPLLTDRFDPIDKLGAVEIPLLFITGSADKLIPPNHSWQLFDAAKRPKEFWLVPEVGHIRSFDEREVQKELLYYLKHYPERSKPSTMKIFDNFDKIPKNRE